MMMMMGVSPMVAAPPIIPTTNPDNLKDKLLAALGADDPVIMSFSRLSIDDIRSNIASLIRESVQEKPPPTKKLAVAQIAQAVQEVAPNPLRTRLLLTIVGSAVKEGHLSGMEVCEKLKELFGLDTENLTMELLDLLDGLIGHKDHKTCQEIFTICFGQIAKLPTTLTGAHHRISTKLMAMVRKLLDRDTLVMPPLCSYCSIMIEYSKAHTYPHWSLNETLNEYLATFDPLINLMTVENTPYLRPVIGHSVAVPTGWKLDQTTLQFHTVDPAFFILRFKGPYAEPQLNLMKYTLKQPGCRDFVTNTMLMLRSGKGTVCPPLDDVYISMIKDAVSDEGGMRVLRATASEIGSLFVNRTIDIRNVWARLLAEMKRPSSTLLQSLAPHRDYLMWTINNSLAFYIKMFKLQKKGFLFLCEVVKLLYPDTSPLPLPEHTPTGVVSLAAASVWTMLATRSFDNPGLQESAPIALYEHIAFLSAPHHTFTNDFLVCSGLNHVNNFLVNFVNSPDSISRPLRHLIDMICNSNTTVLLPGNVTVLAAQVPLSMASLEMLTSHAKMNFHVVISNHVIKMAGSSNSEQVAHPVASCMTPALLETYSRLISFCEVDCFSLKMVMNLFLMVYQAHAYGLLAGLMEMFVYRLQFVHQTPHRVTVLTHFQQIAGQCQQRISHQPQLLYLADSYTIRLMQLLNNNDHTRISSSPQGCKILSANCEEINKVFLLSLARGAIVSGNKNAQLPWCKPFFEYMAAQTPAVGEWSPLTLKHFPTFIAGFCSPQPIYPPLNLTYMVGEEINRLSQLGMRQDVAKHFREKDPSNIFLCVMFRKHSDMDVLPNYASKVTSSWTPATLRLQLRNLIDFVVMEIRETASKGNVQLMQQLVKTSNILANFVFAYHIFPFDTLILVMALRRYSEQDSQISFCLIYHLLVKRPHLKERVDAFVSRASPEFWNLREWNAIHCDYHSKYPEHQYFIRNDYAPASAGGPTYLPVYYGNLCLRFLPVFDVVIHRLIELKPKNARDCNWLVPIVRTFSGLFGYHDAPITYLHDTLLMYDGVLTLARELEKRALVRCFLEAQPYKPLEVLSPQFVTYLLSEEGGRWEVSRNYYSELLKRTNEGLKEGADVLGHVNWRFNEFGNPACMLLYLVSIELMCVPLPSTQVHPTTDPLLAHRLAIGGRLVEAALSSRNPQLYNTLALLLSALPGTHFSRAVFAKIAEILAEPANFFAEGWSSGAQSVLLLTHSFFQHCKNDAVDYIHEFINENATHLQTESQVVYIFKLVSPFLRQWRNATQRKQILYSLYQVMFSLLSENSASNPDLFVDFMYFIKYIYVGDEFKSMLERHLPSLPTGVASKLKFCVADKSD